MAMATVGLVGCGPGDDTLASCHAQEAGGYPALEALAASELVGVEYTLNRVSGCEDTGLPGPLVEATVSVGVPSREPTPSSSTAGGCSRREAEV